MDSVIMQRENERGRLVVPGRRTDDGSRCDLLVVHEVGGTWALYPHGASRFGVRLAAVDADAVQTFLAGGVS